MLWVVEIPEEDSLANRGAETAGLLMPVPGMHRDSVLLEPRDGANIQTLEATGVALSFRTQEVFRVAGIHAAVHLTRARIAVACSHYDKGGGWIGDPLSMSVFNAASKVRAAVRSKGKMLVGHARYPWIARVGSTSKTSFGSAERLVVEASEAEGDAYRLVLELPHQTSAADLAADVVHRAASFRLAAESDLTADERRDLEAMQTARPIAANPARDKNHIYFHEMPTCWYISERSARFSPE